MQPVEDRNPLVLLHELMIQLVKHSLRDTEKDDKMGSRWVEGMVKSSDLQQLQLSCSIRRRGVKPQPARWLNTRHESWVDAVEAAMLARVKLYRRA